MTSKTRKREAESVYGGLLGDDRIKSTWCNPLWSLFTNLDKIRVIHIAMISLIKSFSCRYFTELVYRSMKMY